MVVQSHPELDNISLINTCKPTSFFNGVPVIDLSDPEAKTHLVKACEDLGFFKVINHGVSLHLMARLENEAIKFFNLPQSEKGKAGPPDPFGYGSKRIGPNGDVGWIEYILLNSNRQLPSHKSLTIFNRNADDFRCVFFSLYYKIDLIIKKKKNEG